MSFDLNENALSICAKHYGGWHSKVNGCDKCPIHQECFASTPYGEEALRNYVSRVNAAADAVVSQ